jgi:hypothetical protein
MHDAYGMLHLAVQDSGSYEHHGKGNAVPGRLGLSKADMFSDGNRKEHKATRATAAIRPW